MNRISSYNFTSIIWYIKFLWILIVINSIFTYADRYNKDNHIKEAISLYSQDDISTTIIINDWMCVSIMKQP